MLRLSRTFGNVPNLMARCASLHLKGNGAFEQGMVSLGLVLHRVKAAARRSEISIDAPDAFQFGVAFGDLKKPSVPDKKCASGVQSRKVVKRAPRATYL